MAFGDMIQGAYSNLKDWWNRPPSKNMFGGLSFGLGKKPEPLAPPKPTQVETGTPIGTGPGQTPLLGAGTKMLSPKPVDNLSPRNPVPEKPTQAPVSTPASPSPEMKPVTGTSSTEANLLPETPYTPGSSGVLPKLGMENPTAGVLAKGATENAITESQEQTMPPTPEGELKEKPGIGARIGGGIKNLIEGLPEGGQKAHLTALAFGLGLMAKGGTYSPVPQTAIGPIGEAGLGALQLYMHMDESEKAMAVKNAQFARELQRDIELANYHKGLLANKKETLEQNAPLVEARTKAALREPTREVTVMENGVPTVKQIPTTQQGIVGEAPVKPEAVKGIFPTKEGQVAGTGFVNPYKAPGPIAEVPGKPYELKIGNTAHVFSQGYDGLWRDKAIPDMKGLNEDQMKQYTLRHNMINNEEQSIHKTMQNISGLTESDLGRIFSPDAKPGEAMAIMAKAKIGDKERESYLKQIDRVRQKRARLEAEVTGKPTMGGMGTSANVESWE